MRINFRFLGLLTIVLAVVGGAVFLLHHFQTSRSAALLLSQARESRDAEELPEAIRLYGRYLAFDPHSVEARTEMGSMLVDVGQYKQAYFHLENALRSNPDDSVARKRLVDAAIGIERFSDAKTNLLDHLLKGDPENAEFLALLAVCEQSLGDFDSARQHLESANQAEPSNERYASGLAELLTERFSQPQEARLVLERLIASAPEKSVGYLVRGSWALRQASKISDSSLSDELLGEAWENAAKALELDANDPQTAILAADVAIARGQMDEARAIVSKAIETTPTAAELYVRAAQIELREESSELPAAKLQTAINWLKQGLQNTPGQRDLLWNLALCELDADNLSEVEQLAKELRARQYPEPAVRFLEAKLLISKRQWRQAATLIEQLRAQLERSDELLKQSDFLLALCYQNMGNPDQELAALRRALTIDPLWIPARQALAAALQRSGRLQDSKSELSKIASQPNPPADAVLRLARLLLIEGLNNSSTGQVDWAPLRRLLASLDQVPAAATELTILRAELFVAEGKPDESEMLLQAQIVADPKNLALRQALLALQLRSEQWEKAEASLEAAKATLPDSATLRIERARYLLLRYGKQVDVAELEQLAVPNSAWSLEEKMQIASAMAGFFRALEDYGRSQKYAQLVADSEIGKSNLAIHLLLFDLALQSGELATMGKSLEQVRTIEGRGPLWKVGEAVRLTIQADGLPESQLAEREALNAQAINILAEAAVERPAWARIPSLKGEMFDRQGRKELAIAEYLKAINLGEQSPSLISRALFLLFEQGRYGEADQVVEKLQKQETPFSTDVARVASEVSLKLDNPERALSLMKESAAQSDKQEDHTVLAQLYGINNNPVEAVKEFRTAIAIDPAAPGPWVSLVQMLCRAEKLDEARAVIEEAQAAIGTGDSANALAQCYEALKEFEVAQERYEQALAERPDDPAQLRRNAQFYLKRSQPQLAQPLLEKLAAEIAAANEVDRAWANRNLAQILGFAGDEKQFQRAQELLEANMQLKPQKSEEDLRTQAMILGARPDRQSVLKSISILEDMIRQQPKFSIADNGLLAKLYQQIGDWPRYARTMRDVMANGGLDQPLFLREHASALVGHGDLGEAQIYLDRLKARAPQEKSTNTIEAQLLFRLQKYAPLLALLDARSQDPEFLLWSAELSEVFGTALARNNAGEQALPFLDLATKLYEQVSQTVPDRKSALASFYARQGNGDKTFELLSEVQPTPDELAEIGQSALQSRKLSKSQIEQLIALVKAMFEQHPDNLNIGLCLGDLYGWIVDWKNAAETYRQVLKAHPDQFVALNNLAMVLASSQQDLAAAKAAINQAIAVMGPRDFLLDTRGVVLLALGNPQAAEQDFQASLASSQSPDRLFHLAAAYLAQGRKDEALAAFKQAKDGGVSADTLHPQELPIFERLASLP